jgi:c-di-GMP-binding flagellar brake protein YcgR
MNANVSPDNLDAYTITFRREILFYLRQLINEGERVSVMFNEGRDALLTVLLDVDEEKNLLYLDWGGSDDTNERFLKSQRSIFVANPLGVRNQFVTSIPREVSYKKRRAFRLQRREFFRLSLPMTRRPPCRMTVGSPATEYTLSVIDIGLGGVGLESQEPTLPLEIGQAVPRAVIDLKGPRPLHFDLEIRYVGQRTRGAKQIGHFGCKFMGISGAQEHEIQKYITQIQREEREKLG